MTRALRGIFVSMVSCMAAVACAPECIASLLNGAGWRELAVHRWPDRACTQLLRHTQLAGFARQYGRCREKNYVWLYTGSGAARLDLSCAVVYMFLMCCVCFVLWRDESGGTCMSSVSRRALRDRS